MPLNNKEKKIRHYSELKDFYLKKYWSESEPNNLYKPNGFNNLPENIYSFFCAEIDKDGKVLDLGCGNGLMLKYLIMTSGYKLIPYGVDFVEKSIKQAKEIIHPEYADNFSIDNMNNYSFENGPFDFIFSPIHHIYPSDRKEYLKKIKANCKKGGKVIFYEYSDVLRSKNYNKMSDFIEIKDWKLQIKNYPGVSMGIWRK